MEAGVVGLSAVVTVDKRADREGEVVRTASARAVWSICMCVYV